MSNSNNRIWVTLPNNSAAQCRVCTCGAGGGPETAHAANCEFYVDYSAALTEVVYDDSEKAPSN